MITEEIKKCYKKFLQEMSIKDTLEMFNNYKGDSTVQVSQDDEGLNDQNNHDDQNDFSQDEEDENVLNNLDLDNVQEDLFKVVAAVHPDQPAPASSAQVQSHPLACGQNPPCDSSPFTSKDFQPVNSKRKRDHDTQFASPNHDSYQGGSHAKDMEHSKCQGLADTHHHKVDLCQALQTATDSGQLGIINKLPTQNVSTRTSSRVKMKTDHGTYSILFGCLVLYLMMSLSAAITVHPHPVLVRVVGQVAVFSCSSTFAVLEDVEWLINGTSLNNLQLSDVNLGFGSALQFVSVQLEYNNTMIQCRANTATHRGLISENSTLLVQGLLSAVGSLTVESGFHLSWTAPFALDSNGITYCVDVFNFSTRLYSECDITGTEFTYPLLSQSGCGIYTFTVTPVNVLGNGTSASIEYSGVMSTPTIEQVIPLRWPTEHVLIMSAPVCNIIRVTIVDTEDTEEISTNLTISESNITITAQFALNRHYNVSITASNVAGTATSEEMISTHDISDGSSSDKVDNVNVSATFIPNSNATGALFTFIFINESDGSVDFSKSFHQVFNRSDVSRGVLLPLAMFHPGRYMMFVYDIENNRRLLDGIGYQASGDDNVIINGVRPSSNRSTSDMNCNITSLAGLITVMCPFPFQMSAQLSDPDRVRVLHINTTTETQTPVTVQVMENGEYLVTVFPVQDGVGILSGVQFSQIHIVDDILAPTSTTSELARSQGSSSDSPTLGATTTEKETSMQAPVTIIVVILTVLLVVVVVVVIVVVLGILLKLRQRKKLIPNMYMTREEGSVRSSSITMRSSRSGPPTTTVRTEEPTYTTVHDTQLQTLTHIPNTPPPTPSVQYEPDIDPAYSTVQEIQPVPDPTTGLYSEVVKTQLPPIVSEPTTPTHAVYSVTGATPATSASHCTVNPSSVSSTHYAIVEHKKGSGAGKTFEVSKQVHDDVVYSQVNTQKKMEQMALIMTPHPNL